MTEELNLEEAIKEETDNILNNFIEELKAIDINTKTNEELLFGSKLIINNLITTAIKEGRIEFNSALIYPLVFNLTLYNKKNSSIFNFEDLKEAKGDYLIKNEIDSKAILNKLLSLDININECILLEKVFIQLDILKSLLVTQIRIEFLNTMSELIEEGNF